MNVGELPFRISIAAVRVNCCLTQRELAERLGVSKTSIANWETGKSTPNINAIRKLSELSKIPMDLIFVPYESNKIGLE